MASQIKRVRYADDPVNPRLRLNEWTLEEFGLPYYSDLQALIALVSAARAHPHLPHWTPARAIADIVMRSDEEASVNVSHRLRSLERQGLVETMKLGALILWRATPRGFAKLGQQVVVYEPPTRGA